LGGLEKGRSQLLRGKSEGVKKNMGEEKSCEFEGGGRGGDRLRLVFGALQELLTHRKA